jgi:hypothetical protein
MLTASGTWCALLAPPGRFDIDVGRRRRCEPRAADRHLRFGPVLRRGPPFTVLHRAAVIADGVVRGAVAPAVVAVLIGQLEPAEAAAGGQVEGDDVRVGGAGHVLVAAEQFPQEYRHWSQLAAYSVPPLCRYPLSPDSCTSHARTRLREPCSVQRVILTPASAAAADRSKRSN